jgi:hypothetical protein
MLNYEQVPTNYEYLVVVLAVLALLIFASYQETMP